MPRHFFAILHTLSTFYFLYKAKCEYWCLFLIRLKAFIPTYTNLILKYWMPQIFEHNRFLTYTASISICYISPFLLYSDLPLFSVSFVFDFVIFFVLKGYMYVHMYEHVVKAHRIADNNDRNFSCHSYLSPYWWV